MSEELKFQKLSEVELVEKASANARHLVEEDGKIKRVKGGLGGAGIPTFDLTPYIADDASNVNTEMMSSGVLIINPIFDDATAEEFFKLASAGAMCVHVDGSKIFTLLSGGNIPDDAVYTVSGVYSTQFFDAGTLPEGTSGESFRGCLLYGGLVDMLMLSEGGMQFMTFVAYEGDDLMAQFAIPFAIVALGGLIA